MQGLGTEGYTLVGSLVRTEGTCVSGCVELSKLKHTETSNDHTPKHMQMWCYEDSVIGAYAVYAAHKLHDVRASSLLEARIKHQTSSIEHGATECEHMQVAISISRIAVYTHTHTHTHVAWPRHKCRRSPLRLCRECMVWSRWPHRPDQIGGTRDSGGHGCLLLQALVT